MDDNSKNYDSFGDVEPTSEEEVVTSIESPEMSEDLQLAFEKITVSLSSRLAKMFNLGRLELNHFSEDSAARMLFEMLTEKVASRSRSPRNFDCTEDNVKLLTAAMWAAALEHSASLISQNTNPDLNAAVYMALKLPSTSVANKPLAPALELLFSSTGLDQSLYRMSAAVYYNALNSNNPSPLVLKMLVMDPSVLIAFRAAHMSSTITKDLENFISQIGYLRSVISTATQPLLDEITLSRFNKVMQMIDDVVFKLQ